MLHLLVLLAAVTWLTFAVSSKGNGMLAPILLVLGTIQMGLHIFLKFGEPAWVQQAVGFACVVLSLITLALFVALKMKEAGAGTRGRP